MAAAWPLTRTRSTGLDSDPARLLAHGTPGRTTYRSSLVARDPPTAKAADRAVVAEPEELAWRRRQRELGRVKVRPARPRTPEARGTSLNEAGGTGAGRERLQDSTPATTSSSWSKGRSSRCGHELATGCSAKNSRTAVPPEREVVAEHGMADAARSGAWRGAAVPRPRRVLARRARSSSPQDQRRHVGQRRPRDHRARIGPGQWAQRRSVSDACAVARSNGKKVASGSRPA